MIKIQTILALAKSMTAKSVKDDSNQFVTVAMVKFADLKIDRDMLDELMGTPIGWCRSTLYDEQGAPLRRFGVQVFGRSLRVSGTVKGGRNEGTLALLQAELDECEARCVPLGALVDGRLTWAARGDEVEVISDLLGKECLVEWEITDADTEDMFRSQSKAAAKATQATNSILQSLGKSGDARP